MAINGRATSGQLPHSSRQRSCTCQSETKSSRLQEGAPCSGRTAAEVGCPLHWRWGQTSPGVKQLAPTLIAYQLNPAGYGAKWRPRSRIVPPVWAGGHPGKVARSTGPPQSQGPLGARREIQQPERLRNPQQGAPLAGRPAVASHEVRHQLERAA